MSVMDELTFSLSAPRSRRPRGGASAARVPHDFVHLTPTNPLPKMYTLNPIEILNPTGDKTAYNAGGKSRADGD